MIPSIYLINSRTKGAILIYSLTLFALGVLAGILLQKYAPVGQLLRAVLTPKPTPVALDRIEVPISMLRSQRVMVALAFGQSNSANSGESPRTAGERVYNFYQGRLYRAQDPLLGADAEWGSVWTRLGDRIIAERLYDAVVFVPLGVGWSRMARWKPDGDLHPRLLKAITEVKAQQLAITHLLWHQGEQDAYLKTSKDAYKQMFLEMLLSIRKQGVNAPIYVSVATRCGKERGDREIQQAQQELVDPSQRIYPGPNTDLLGFAYRYDGCHFSDEGLELEADLWLQALKQPHDSVEMTVK